MTGRSITLWKGVLAGVAALSIAGAAIGVVSAQQGPQGGQQGADRRDQLFNAVASKLGVSSDKLKQAFTDARKELGLPDQQGEGRGRMGPRPGGLGGPQPGGPGPNGRQGPMGGP